MFRSQRAAGAGRAAVKSQTNGLRRAARKEIRVGADGGSRYRVRRVDGTIPVNSGGTAEVEFQLLSRSVSGQGLFVLKIMFS